MVVVQKCGSGKSISVGNVGMEINAIEEMQWEYAYSNTFGALIRRISPRQSPRTFGLPKVLGGYH